jgi:protein-tyrosine phosphatase
MYRILADIYYFSRMIKDKALYVYSEFLLKEQTNLSDEVKRLNIIETNEGFYNIFKNLFIEPTKIVDNIYLGNAYNSSNFHQLDEFNITSVVNITNEIPNYFEEEDNFDYLKISIDDTNKDSLINHFDIALKYIKEIQEKKHNQNILIHCYMGSSRSATIVLAYLIKNYHFTLEDALKLLKEKRPVVNINVDFWKDLEIYYKSLYGEPILC